MYKIGFMDIHTMDLNLLVVFDAMARQQSVNRAAEVLGLSQSATSGALARLRKTFNDPLFVRTGARMVPTPRAQQLAPAVRQVVQAIESQILQPATFDPAQAERSFTVLTPDIGEVAFLPRVLQQLHQQAPGVRLHALSKSRADAAQALEKGDADLAVGFFPDLQKPGYYQQGLFMSTYVCITAADNAHVGESLTLKQYLAARHVVVRPDGREHLLDRFLEDKGWHRYVTLELCHFMSLLALLPDSDLIATVPQDIATVVGRHIALREVALPFRPPQLRIRQHWHGRMHNDCANRWLRSLFYVTNRRENGAMLV